MMQTFSHSELIDDRVLRKCFNILDKLEIGQMILVKEYAPNNPDLFIRCCKQYFDCHKNLRFSDNYSEIRKVERVKTFKEIENLFG